MRTFSLLAAVLVCLDSAPSLRAQDATKTESTWLEPASPVNVFCVDDSFGVPEEFRKTLPGGVRTISDLTNAIHQVTGFSVKFTPISDGEAPLTPELSSEGACRRAARL
jgi:hypothetical protein